MAFTLKLDPSYTLNTSHDDWDILPFTVPQFTSPSFDPQAAHLPLTPQHVIAVKTNPARIIFRHAGMYVFNMCFVPLFTNGTRFLAYILGLSLGHLKLTMSLYGAEDHERNYRYGKAQLRIVPYLLLLDTEMVLCCVILCLQWRSHFGFSLCLSFFQFAAMVRLGSKGFPPLEHTINGNPVPPHVTGMDSCQLPAS